MDSPTYLISIPLTTLGLVLAIYLYIVIAVSTSSLMWSYTTITPETRILYRLVIGAIAWVWPILVPLGLLLGIVFIMGYSGEQFSNLFTRIRLYYLNIRMERELNQADSDEEEHQRRLDEINSRMNVEDEV